MALKKKISKEEFDALKIEFKSEYVPTATGYRLDLSDDSDSIELKNAKDRESQMRREAESKLLEAQEQLERLNSEFGNKNKQDIETLRKSWEKQSSEKEKAFHAKIDTLSKFAKQSLIDSVATNLANEIFTPGSSKLLAHHVKARLSADLDSETFATKILDKDGRVSILTTEDLKKEFLTNPDFSEFVMASKASGSAAAKQKTVGTSGESVSFSKLDLDTKVQHLKQKLESNQ